MKKINLLIFTCYITLYSCSQTNQQKTKEMNNFIDDVMLQVKRNTTTPTYNLQVNKNGCRILVETNDMPPGTMGIFFGKGESSMISLNDCILKSGKQNIKLRIFPREEEEFISSFAHIDLKLYYNSNKDSGFKNYECLATVKLPEDIADKKLPYFEMNIPFEATVPYDFSEILNNAINLKTISDIKEKVVAKFEVKRKLIEEGNASEYYKDKKDFYVRLGTMFYASREELLEEYNVGKELFDIGMPDRKVEPINNYELEFYANNKLVILRQIKNKESVLNVTYEYQGKSAISSANIILYMPKGSTELKVW